MRLETSTGEIGAFGPEPTWMMLDMWPWSGHNGLKITHTWRIKILHWKTKTELVVCSNKAVFFTTALKKCMYKFQKEEVRGYC